MIWSIGASVNELSVHQKHVWRNQNKLKFLSVSYDILQT